MRLLIFCWMICVAQATVAWAQDGVTPGQKEVNDLVDQSKTLIGTDSAGAINLAQQAIQKARAINYAAGEGQALKNIGMVYYRKGNYLQTLDYWTKSLEAFEKGGDEGSMANMLSNIGAVYLNQGADAQALDYNLRSLKIAEKINDTPRMINALSNIGSTYYNKKDPVALDYLLKVLPMIKTKGDMYRLSVVTGNIGEIYYDLRQDDKALQYYQQAIEAAGTEQPASFAYNGLGKLNLRAGKLAEALQYLNLAVENAQKFGDNLEVSRTYRSMAAYYEKVNNLPQAIAYYNKAKELAENMDDVKPELRFVYQALATTYSKLGDYKNAFQYQTLNSSLKDTLYNIESKKQLNQLQFDFELEKKEAELKLQDQKLQNEKQARTGITITVVILLLGAIIIYRGYLQKLKINKILDGQIAQNEALLLNILPKEIANELKTAGKTQPNHYDEVSVLFTDIVQFTTIADQMTPNYVVEELNECFTAFDNIIEKHGLEKIKTIGDAYMCAGNIPSPLPNHTFIMIKAALDMQDFLKGWNDRQLQRGKPVWEVRIGIHLGPLVAGVVGRKKYAYDIWGSTVNIASRMESACPPGEINISADVYEKVKDYTECVYRGKIIVKNLGELDMYLVKGVKQGV